MRAVQAAGRAGVDVAFLQFDFRAHRLKALEVQVDGARADGAAAGQRDFRLAATREERADDEEARAHFAHEFVRRFGRGDRFGVKLQNAADFGFGVAVAVHRDPDAEARQNFRELGNVGQMRDAGQRQRLVGQKARHHQRQRRVLGARDADFAA